MTITPSHRHSLYFLSRLPAFLAALGICACSTLPTSGPQTSDIRDEYQPDAQTHPFMLVNVTPNTVEALSRRSDPGLVSRFGSGTPPVTTIGRGDSVNVNLWESGPEPLFASTPTVSSQGLTSSSSRGVAIPEQPVGDDGCISIPYAGRIPVLGLTLTQAQHAIETALAGKAQKPQALVSRTRNVSGSVTVIGEVTAGNRIPLTGYGEKLLDVLAEAGGVRSPAYETQVQLTRGGDSAIIPLQRVLQDPHENVLMQPGDSVVVMRQPETFTAFGATGRNTQIEFGSTQVSLAEAVAKAGGLLDYRADPQGVFLFRYETPALAAALGQATATPAGDGRIPVVYRLDLTRAGGYFLAQNFAVHDRDILYIANAPATELEKFLNLVGLITQPAISGAVAESALK